MSDRWAPIRRLAEEARASVQIPQPVQGLQLVLAALRQREIEILPLVAEDPLLRGARAIYDRDYVGYNHALEAPQAGFALAHELGHAVLHFEACRCMASDIDEMVTPDRLPYGRGAIDVYNPRQRRELEANVFAAAFLLPAKELGERFLAGATFSELASDFGVSPSATLNALSTVLLSPPSSKKERSGGQPDLDPTQKAAAVAAGPVLISAGPGTGKTSTLTGRIDFLLKKGVPGRNVLALTFSNRAANEMRERLTEMLPDQVHELTISTFHGFCLEVLRQYHEAVALPADIAIIDQVDAFVLLEGHLSALDLQHYFNLVNPSLYLKNLVRAISRAKDELKSPEDYAQLAEAARVAAGTDERALTAAARWAEVARVYAVYESLLAERGMIDFGGLIMRTVELLRARSDLLNHLRVQHTHVLVDEYQDMNRASALLLQMLAGDGAGLWVVGDLRQAIYRFRGASPANLTNFTRDFPGGRVLNLGKNYRSDPRLVALFSAVGKRMDLPGAPAPVWEAFWPGEPPPRVWVAKATNEVAEAEGIAREVRGRCHEGRTYKDQVILVRTHAQADVLVDTLTRAGIPSLYLGDLFVREEVRDLLAIVSLMVEGSVSALLRVGAMPEHLLSRGDRARLIRFTRERSISFPSALQHAEDAGLDVGAVATAADLHSMLDAVGWQTSAWQFIARYLFGRNRLIRRLCSGDDAATVQRRMAIGQLLAVARAYDERPLSDGSGSAAALRGFLRHVRRLVAAGDQGTRMPLGGEDIDAVRILTVHASKGLEFPVVYLTNLAEKRFPFREMWDPTPPPPGLLKEDVSDLFLEEACLFFVGISRAKHELILSYATHYGKSDYAASPLLELVEPFFAAAPPALLEWSRTEQDPHVESASPRNSRRRFDMTEVELYMKCPRRYEYRYVLSLPEHDDTLGYKRFLDCVSLCTAQLRNADAGGFETEDDVLALLAETWENHGPADHAYEEVYRVAATAVVLRTWAGLGELVGKQPWRDFIDVAMGEATIRIRFDSSELAPDGHVRIVRMRAGAESDGDRKAPRLALTRSAVASELEDPDKVSIELEYLASGEIKMVTHAGRWEETRIAQIEEALNGILASRYDPEPREARDCLSCPYWIVCPT
jgi:DNA helicase II / ATP-dependent DNA helicase PcrA